MNNYIEIVKGSKVDFELYLVDENGFPFSLKGFNDGELKFRNCEGTETLISLTLPGEEDGKISIEIESSDTANADKKWQSADLTLTETVSGEPVIVPLNNQFKIIEPNT